MSEALVFLGAQPQAIDPVRLNSIKLAGFKSFAEPTQFMLPGQLVGVVGPNGCGKSNIMDAVRWVLGESKASELRGESMQDVIFNGTNHRKPASRSSVELVFDNSDHRAGGQWGQYGEIAVRRVLTRDGNSSYYINNQPVRRRDVQDVFLGTGLGPRAYAIIGQGTISRIIESRPEELRLFLEEAAGVSKYKERRRETENRLADTRENLTRVEDILRELNTNLEKLEKQAEVAQRFKDLQTTGTRRQHQLWRLKQVEAEADQARIQGQGQEAATALEERMAELRHVEADIESVRQAHYAASDTVNRAQGELYAASAEVGKLEAEIRYVVEGRRRAEMRQSQLNEQLGDWQQRREAALADIEGVAEQLARADEQGETLAARVEEQAMALPELEDGLRLAQQRASEQTASVNQVQQQLQVLSAEQRHVGEQQRQLETRRERLVSDRKALALPDEQRLNQLSEQLGEQKQAKEEADARIAELQVLVPELDESRRTQQASVNTESARMAELQARLEALKALQESVKTDGKLGPWLAKHGLEGMAGLWQRLKVEAGWEGALEAALRERVGALEVSRLELVRAFGQDSPPARLAFFAPTSPSAPPAEGALPSLASRLRLGDAALQSLLSDWLAGCLTAPTLDEALAARATLQPGQLIFVPDGHAVDAHSVSFYAPDSEQAGMLARAQEIDNLEKQQRAQGLIAEEARSALLRFEAQYQDANQKLLAERRDTAEVQAQVHALEVEVLRLSQLAEQARARCAQIDGDLAELDLQLEEQQERRVTAEARFEELDMQLADSQERQAQMQDRVTEAERKLSECREQQRTVERQAQEAVFATRALQARQAELQRTIATAEAQDRSLADEMQRVVDELSRLDDAAAQGGLQEALNLKLGHEETLAARRSEYDDLTQRLRAGDERRMKLERDLEPQRQRIIELQLKEQAARLGLEQYAQALNDAGADIPAVQASIEEEGVRLQGLQGEIDRINRDINALGAVNLAALEELGAARDRKIFLDAQSSDLVQAMETLEDAIR